MKIVFTKHELLENLFPVMGTVSSKNTITSLEGVLIETLGGNTVRFTTYDMNKGTRVTFEATEVIREGSYIIGAQRFMQIIKVMEDGEITVEVDDKFTVRISCENSSFTMYALNGVDFPGLPELSGDRGFRIEGEKLKDMIGKVIHSISENDSRAYLAGVYFKIEGNKMQLVSCDSHTLSECSCVCDIESVGQTAADSFSFILPGHALGELTKLLSAKKGEDVCLYLARKHAIIKMEGQVFFTRLIDGEYFDYQRIIPRDQTIFVTCSRERLLGSLERVLLVADEKSQGSGRNYVKLEIRDGILCLTSSSSTGKVYDEIPCIQEGENLVIGFNCRYLINNIRACGDEEIHMAFRNSNQAVIIQNKNTEDKYFYMIMPVRMSE